MNNKIFIIYTANGCNACEIFKEKELNKLLVSLHKYNIGVKHFNANSLRDEDMMPGMHPQLKAAKKWFPSFYLFDKNLFNNHDSNLSGLVMGGQFKNGTIVADQIKSYSYKHEKIIEWILTSLDSSIMTKNKFKLTDDDEYSMIDTYKLF